MTDIITKLFAEDEHYAIKKVEFARTKDNEILYHGTLYYARKAHPKMEFGKNNIIDDVLDEKICVAIENRFDILEVETKLPQTSEELNEDFENFKKNQGSSITLYLTVENKYNIGIDLCIITNPPHATDENFSLSVSKEELDKCAELCRNSFKRYDEAITQQ